MMFHYSMQPWEECQLSATILVVDDDPHICDVIAYALEQDGMNVTTAENGEDGLRRFTSMPVHMVVLDVGMPVMDGLEMCREIRKSSDVPILFLSARDDEVDRIVGLEIGGDDYVTKPFSPRELMARVKAILKRAKPQIGGVGGSLKQGRLLVDTDRQEASPARCSAQSDITGVRHSGLPDVAAWRGVPTPQNH